jgi:hypothetical protein
MILGSNPTPFTDAALGSWLSICFYVVATLVALVSGGLVAIVQIKKLRGKNTEQVVIELKLNAMQRKQAAMGKYTHRTIHELRNEMHQMGLDVQGLTHALKNGLAKNVSDMREELKENTKRTDENYGAIDALRKVLENKN